MKTIIVSSSIYLFGCSRFLLVLTSNLRALSTDAPVRDMIGAGSPDAPFYMKFLAGAITGGVGSVIGNRKCH